MERGSCTHDSVIQINQRNFQQSWQFRLPRKYVAYIVSTDNPVIMFIFLICSLVLCWGNVSNSKVTWNLHNYITFDHKMFGGTKGIMSPLSKSWGDMSPTSPHKLGPGLLVFDETLAQPDFAVVNCSDVVVSVFHSPVSTRGLILLKLWTAVS